MRVNRIDHFNIRTRDLDRLCEFYTQVLCLEVGDRPPFDSPGVWLYAGGHPILHVGVANDSDSGSDAGGHPILHVGVANDSDSGSDSTFPLDHIALETEGLGMR